MRKKKLSVSELAKIAKEIRGQAEGEELVEIWQRITATGTMTPEDAARLTELLGPGLWKTDT